MPEDAGQILSYKTNGYSGKVVLSQRKGCDYMYHPKEIEEYIRGVFEEYDLSYDTYFSEFSANNERIKKSMVENGELNIKMVARAAEILGTTVDAILDMDDERVLKWYWKFPLLQYKSGLERTYQRSFLGSCASETLLMMAIMGVKYTRPKPARFNYSCIKERMLDLLNDYDIASPGTVHQDATIEHLHFETSGICHYDKITQMVDSFVDMVARGEELFFKALHQDLSEDEVGEYNIIVTATGMKDKHYVIHDGLYYSDLVACRNVYLSENCTDFFDYVLLDKTATFSPWRCIEFIKDRQRVEKYFSLVPQAKGLMREFTFRALRFECSFTWSDAPVLSDEAIEELSMEHTWIARKLKTEYGGKAPTVVYVPKTADELGDDGQYLEMLKRLSGSANKGGIKLPAHGAPIETDIPKVMARIRAFGG